MGSCPLSTLWMRRSTDHGAHRRLVPNYKAGWRLVEPPWSRWRCHQLAEDYGDKGTREIIQQIHQRATMILQSCKLKANVVQNIPLELSCTCHMYWDGVATVQIRAIIMSVVQLCPHLHELAGVSKKTHRYSLFPVLHFQSPRQFGLLLKQAGSHGDLGASKFVLCPPRKKLTNTIFAAIIYNSYSNLNCCPHSPKKCPLPPQNIPIPPLCDWLRACT